MFIYFFNGSHIVIWGLFWSVIFSQDKKKVEGGGGGGRESGKNFWVWFEN